MSTFPLKTQEHLSALCLLKKKEKKRTQTTLHLRRVLQLMPEELIAHGSQVLYGHAPFPGKVKQTLN